MVYTSDAARQDAAIRLFTERGIDVTVLDQPIDVNFVSYMEYSADPESKFRYCRVDAELDSLTSTEDAPTLDAEKLTDLMREASGNKELTVEVKPLVNDSVPVMLVEDEQTRRFNDMAAFTAIANTPCRPSTASCSTAAARPSKNWPPVRKTRAACCWPASSTTSPS